MRPERTRSTLPGLGCPVIGATERPIWPVLRGVSGVLGLQEPQSGRVLPAPPCRAPLVTAGCGAQGKAAGHGSGRGWWRQRNVAEAGPETVSPATVVRMPAKLTLGLGI